VDEYAPAGEDGADASYCCVSYLHARLVGDGVEPRVDGVEMDAFGWFAPDELPRPLAPPGHGEEIYAAWAASGLRRGLG
jgi:hypothetical protein